MIIKISIFRVDLSDLSAETATLAVCVHCAVDCPMLWSKLDYCFEVVKIMGTPGVALATKLESELSDDLIIDILS